MKQPTTLDEYIWKDKCQIVEAAREQIPNFDLQEYYANEEVVWYSQKASQKAFVDTIPIQMYLGAIDALCNLAARQLLTETDVQTVLEQEGMKVRASAITNAFKYAEHDVKYSFRDRGNEPSEQERRNLVLDAVLKENGILGIGDNYTVYVFLPSNNVLDLFCSQLRNRLPQGMIMDEQSERAEGKDIQEGCEHSYYSLEYNKDTSASEWFKIPKGSGTVRQYDTELPPNQLLLRWHGAGRGCADFIKAVAAVVQEYRYEAHFDVGQPTNVLGGVFYKPK